MNKRILVVCAHTADFCSRAGGTIIRYLNRGYTIKVIALTFGERGESREFWNANLNAAVADCKAARKSEALAAAGFLGIDIEFKDWDDYPLFISCEREAELALDIQNFAPDVLLTHYTNDPINEDHAVAAKAAIRAASIANAARLKAPFEPIVIPDIFLFESTVPHTEFNGFSPDTYVDITDVFNTKMEALARFTSQPFLGEYYTTYAQYRARQAAGWTKNPAIKYAEGFERYIPYVGEELPLRQIR
ncbi:MAG: PIG-L family deacetylase [Oscillospiraceae bacterium]|jgi:4-oxalomesaconate hydratase|nr:PIG-L family deacetylase [Oscillospiraceae bacterium]